MDAGCNSVLDLVPAYLVLVFAPQKLPSRSSTKSSLKLPAQVLPWHAIFPPRVKATLEMAC